MKGLAEAIGAKACFGVTRNGTVTVLYKRAGRVLAQGMGVDETSARFRADKMLERRIKSGGVGLVA